MRNHRAAITAAVLAAVLALLIGLAVWLYTCRVTDCEDTGGNWTPHGLTGTCTHTGLQITLR